MSGHKEKKNAAWRNDPKYAAALGWPVCRNCGERTRGGHFVPPSMGEAGFYYCQRKDSK